MNIRVAVGIISALFILNISTLTTAKCLTAKEYKAWFDGAMNSARPAFGIREREPIFIVVQQSAFEKAEFAVEDNLFSVANENPQPTEIRFFNVVKDMEETARLRNSNRLAEKAIRVRWSNLEIVVDGGLGMRLSYLRELTGEPDKVTLFVPTREDRERWMQKVKECYREYEEAWWETKENWRIEKEKQEKEEREKMKRFGELRQQAVKVYPE